MLLTDCLHCCLFWTTAGVVVQQAREHFSIPQSFEVEQLLTVLATSNLSGVLHQTIEAIWQTHNLLGNGYNGEGGEHANRSQRGRVVDKSSAGRNDAEDATQKSGWGISLATPASLAVDE